MACIILFLRKAKNVARILAQFLCEMDPDLLVTLIELPWGVGIVLGMSIGLLTLMIPELRARRR